MTENLKRTPLFDAHVALGAKMVPFAGWEMPVQYRGVIEEHNAVRNAGGLFDVSHMGEIWVTGPKAEAAIDRLTCNDVKILTDGRAQYSALINERGGVIDDIIIYRFNRERFFICVNANNADKDFAWIKRNNPLGVEINNVSAEFGQIAIQGPHSVAVLTKLAQGFDPAMIRYFYFQEGVVLGVKAIIARTGYTGEDGFEIFLPAKNTKAVWDALLEAGKSEGIVPAGLGARDTLRLEACLPLHGHELGEEITAIESGLGWIVKPQKGDFIGKSVLEPEKRDGSKRVLVGFYVDDPGIVRGEDKVLSIEGNPIGIVTSGTKTPTVNRALGLALVDARYKALDTKFVVEVRGRRIACHVVKTPFYKRG